MFAREIRASKGFVIFVVCVAYFTDMLLSNLIVPMLPYALLERVGLPEKDVQKWNSILLALYGGSQMVGSCMSNLMQPSLSECICAFSPALSPEDARHIQDR